MAALDGLPDGARSRPTTVRVIAPLLGAGITPFQKGGGRS